MSGTFIQKSKLTTEHELHSGDSFVVAQIAITLGGDPIQVDLAEEGHQLVDMAHSIVMSVVPAGRRSNRRRPLLRRRNGGQERSPQAEYGSACR